MPHESKGVPSYGAPTAKNQPLGPFEAGEFQMLNEEGMPVPAADAEAVKALGEFAPVRGAKRLSSLKKDGGKVSIPSEGTPNPQNPTVG